MKATLFLVASLLFALAMHPLPAAAAGSDLDPVLDTDGDEVVAGANYYIVSAIRGPGGGGVLLAATGGNTCPVDVVQSPRELVRGRPVTISPVNTSTGAIVRESTDNNIKFSKAPDCVSSGVWRVDDADESTGIRFVTTGGEEGNPAEETLSSWFRIEKLLPTGQTYKIRFCPTVCSTCNPQCGDVGIYPEAAGFVLFRRLALTEPPFLCMFIKASASSRAAEPNLIIKKATDREAV